MGASFETGGAAPPPGCEPLCLGCAPRHSDAAESAGQKSAFLGNRLASWAERLTPLQAIPEPLRLGYRDRATLAAHWGREGWALGLRVRDEVVAIPHCPIHTGRLNAVAQTLAAHLPPGDDFPLAYLVASGAQFTLVLKCSRLPRPDWLTPQLTAQLAAAGAEGLWLHLFPSVGRRIFAKNGWHLVWGVSHSRDTQGDLYGPAAFQQLLPALYRAALDEAAGFLAPGPGDAVMDLYCGRGTTLKRWLAAGAETIGVELGGEAVACALLNAPEATVLRGSCSHRLPQLESWWNARPDARRLAWVNPPRTGLEAPVSEWLVKARPERLAYLSCSAGTLARDLELLERGGYRVVRLIPYDFFPRTWHVETLALLSRSPLP